MSGILRTDYNTAKLFVRNNRFSKASYTNGTGSPVTLQKGRILGRITTGGKVTPQLSTATDGSQQPIGVCADDYTVAAGDTLEITYCDGGDVDQNLLLFSGAETLATVITDDVSIGDALARNTHIKVVPTKDLTGYDN